MLKGVEKLIVNGHRRILDLGKFRLLLSLAWDPVDHGFNHVLGLHPDSQVKMQTLRGPGEAKV